MTIISEYGLTILIINETKKTPKVIMKIKMKNKALSCAKIAHVANAIGILLFSSALAIAEQTLPLEPISVLQKNNSCKKWQMPMNAHLSNVSIAENGKKVLVSTSGSFTGVRLYSDTGKKLWQFQLKQPARAQSISKSGNIMAVSGYGDRMVVLNSKGKLLWEKSHLGKPFVFEEKNLILLFNDEDSETNNAFFGYDLKGNLKFTAQTKFEALNVFLSNDEKLLLITHAQNYASVFDLEGRKITEFRIEKPPIWIASEGLRSEKLKLFILSASPDNSKKQFLSAFEIDSKNGDADETWKVNLEPDNEYRRYQAIHLIDNTLVLFGNFPKGQAIAGHDLESGKKLWQKSHPLSTVFSYPSLYNHGMLSIIQQDAEDGFIQVLSLNKEGAAPWSVKAPAKHGIFSYDVNKTQLAIGAGEPGAGILYFFGLGNCKKQKL